MSSALRRRDVIAWAAYDWANSAFTTTVMAGFFPTFFRHFWSVGVAPTMTTFRLGLANGIAGLIVALLAPLLGALADIGARRKAFVMGWTALGVLATAGLYFIGAGHWGLAALLFVLATMGYNGAMVFYDALLLDVARPEEFDRVSAWGYGFGYLGGGCLFALNVLMVSHPSLFGLPSAAAAVQLSFLDVALWWALFSLPLAAWVREHQRRRSVSGSVLLASWRELQGTARKVLAQRALWMFLLAYWLYIDGVNTVVKMAVDYGSAIGLPSAALLTALLLTQFVAFPAALLFGWIAGRSGPRPLILIGIGAYVAVSIGAVWLHTATQFYALAVIIGLVQGGVQSLSRSLYGRFVPPQQAAEFFGFYNMLGKFAAVIGPILVGVTAALSGSSRASIASVAVLFIAGGVLLSRVELRDIGVRTP